MTSMEAGSCSCDYSDFEPIQCMGEDAWRKARKEHKCDECLRKIKPGERYRIITAMWDGSWTTTKRCPQCYQIGLDYCCGVLGPGSVYEEVWESLGVDLRTGETKGERQ